MTPRERMMAVLHGEIPDRVPCAPDISNMVPCRLTGKPFWDIYLYQDPPLWKAYIDAVKYFGFDGFLGAIFSLDEGNRNEPEWTEAIIQRTENRIVTQHFREDEWGERQWLSKVTIYDRDQPRTTKEPALLGLPDVPPEWEPVEGIREWPKGEALLKLVMEEMGEHGIVAGRAGQTVIVGTPEDIYGYHQNPDKYRERRDQILERAEATFEKIMALETKPHYISMGGSGTLIWQTPAMFRELGLPILKRMSSLCKEAGIPSAVHSCGPERELVRMAAEETDLTLIDPLEVPPMGDCNLRELKQNYGDKIALKGNLHTTEVMLKGSKDDVLAASRQAIEDAAEGGGFILATGDQCGRDTPDENILAMVEACETWGKY